jgi:hypothetical protein
MFILFSKDLFDGVFSEMRNLCVHKPVSISPQRISASEQTMAFQDTPSCVG